MNRRSKFHPLLVPDRGADHGLEIRHPRLVGLLEYWRSKCGGRRMPSRADIDPVEMREWLGNLVLVEFFGDVSRFKVRVDGTNVVNYGGGERTGKGIESLTSDGERRVLLAQYEPVLRERRPAYYETEYTNSEQRLLREQKLLLPLSNDGTTVNMVLAGIYYQNLRPWPGEE